MTSIRRRRGFLCAVIVACAALLGGCGADATSSPTKVGSTDCSDASSTELRDCLESMARDDEQRLGIDDALERAEQFVADEPDAGNACHVAWHALGERDGRTRYAEESERARDLRIDGACRQGYAHGVLIGRWQELDVDELHHAANRDCASGAAGSMMQCIHAFGHAAWNRQQAAAFTTCDTLDPTDDAPPEVFAELAGRGPAAAHAQVRLECAKGAAMDAAFPTDGEQPEQPWTACASQPAVERSLCRGFAPLQASMLGMSDADAAALCGDPTWTDADQVACGFGVGAGVGDVEVCPDVPTPPARRACVAAAKALERGGFASGTGDATLLEQLVRSQRARDR